MNVNSQLLDALYAELPAITRQRIESAVDILVAAKESGKRVVVATGSGPNLHEGVTTLVAELMHKGIIDGVTTSSAVVSHEMAGTLDRVKRVDIGTLPLNSEHANFFHAFEATVLTYDQLAQLQNEMDVDTLLYQQIMGSEGKVIIKAAGNMAYPMGLRTEKLAMEVLELAKSQNRPFEEVVGIGADPMTMIGAGARLNKPVLVTVPQLVGGGKVGLAIGDSIAISDRSRRVAQLFADADVVIESAIALTQEIHDGPFETFTGHGIWSDWLNEWTYSLKEKNIIRIDLDHNLDRVWQNERSNRDISNAVIEGLPKTKVTGVPFRMEMSGFSRLQSSLPIVGDIGTVFPIIALKTARRLNIALEFMSYNQSTTEGRKVREWIADSIRPVERGLIFD